MCARACAAGDEHVMAKGHELPRATWVITKIGRLTKKCRNPKKRKVGDILFSLDVCRIEEFVFSCFVSSCGCNSFFPLFPRLFLERGALDLICFFRVVAKQLGEKRELRRSCSVKGICGAESFASDEIFRSDATFCLRLDVCFQI